MNKNNNLLSYVAELYYERGLSQKEIGSIIGASRPTVSRLIEEAKHNGVVEIKINTPITQNAKLSNKLRKAFNLHDAIVVEGSYDFNKAINICGKAAASVFSSFLSDNLTIGIAWGRAVSAFTEALNNEDFENIHVAQMVGCISAGNPNLDSVAAAQRLAKKLNSTYSTINAPLYVEGKQVYNYLIDEPLIKYSLEQAAKVDISVSGVAAITDPSNTVHQSGFFERYNLMSLKDKGAVSHYLGHFLDINGKEIVHDTIYSISVSLESALKAKYRINISATAERAEATLAVLRGGYANILICDEPLAKRLLEIK